jgi:hypothetical protein
LLFDVLIALIYLFDVLIVYGVFGVLFGFQRSDFRSSDLFPILSEITVKKLLVIILLKFASEF